MPSPLYYLRGALVSSCLLVGMYPQQCFAGILAGNVTNLTNFSQDLTDLGSTDWAIWNGGALAPSDSSSAGSGAIGSLTLIGAPPPFDFGGRYQGRYTWSNGTNSTNDSGVDFGMVQAFPANNGEGFRLVLPADTSLQRINLFAGSSNATGQLTATLSDASAPVFIDSQSGNSVHLYSLDFQANSPGQTLTLDYIRTGTSGTNPNILIQAAALEVPTGESVINLDFNIGAIGTKVGFEPGGFSGISGTWNAMAITNGGSGETSGALLTDDGSLTDNPVVFSLTSGTHLATGIAAPSALRGDVIFLQTGVQENDLEWEITGLIAGNAYDLKFFGQTTNDPNFIDGVNAMEFQVDGAGSIITDDVATFLNVIADANGMITGSFIHDNAEAFSSVSGLQIRGSFQVVPEPASYLLWISLGLILAGWRRRHRSPRIG